MDRRAPNPTSETPDPIDDGMRAAIESALRSKAAPRPLRIEGRSGPTAAALVAIVGDDRRAHELFVFARGTDALDRCVDYLDGIIDELIRDDDDDDDDEHERFLPLDWEGRPYDGGVVFVRGEVRDYFAEEEAARLLGEPVPRRGLDSA